MVYLEFLRARRIFTWFAIVLLTFLVLGLIGAYLGNNAAANISSTSSSGTHSVTYRGLGSLGTVTVPVAAMAGFACVCAIALAGALGGSFNRETLRAHFTFVRPLSRARMALLLIAVDTATIVTGALVAFILTFIGVSGALGGHAHYLWGSEVAGIAPLGLGAAFMTYAMLQLATAWAPGRAGAFVAATWVFFVFAIPVSDAKWLGPIATICGWLLYVDPLAYFGGVVNVGNAVSFPSSLVGAIEMRTAAACLVGAAALAIATACWKRVEV